MYGQPRIYNGFSALACPSAKCGLIATVSHFGSCCRPAGGFDRDPRAHVQRAAVAPASRPHRARRRPPDRHDPAGLSRTGLWAKPRASASGRAHHLFCSHLRQYGRCPRHALGPATTSGLINQSDRAGASKAQPFRLRQSAVSLFDRQAVSSSRLPAQVTPRADAVKAGRHSGLSWPTVLARPRLDGGEHGVILDARGEVLPHPS
jgi:hypothetical protein